MSSPLMPQLPLQASNPPVRRTTTGAGLREALRWHFLPSARLLGGSSARGIARPPGRGRVGRGSTGRRQGTEPPAPGLDGQQHDLPGAQAAMLLGWGGLALPELILLGCRILPVVRIDARVHHARVVSGGLPAAGLGAAGELGMAAGHRTRSRLTLDDLRGAETGHDVAPGLATVIKDSFLVAQGCLLDVGVTPPQLPTPPRNRVHSAGAPAAPGQPGRWSPGEIASRGTAPPWRARVAGGQLPGSHSVYRGPD